MTSAIRPSRVSLILRVLASASLLALALAAFWGPALAVASNHNEKVQICHATGSDDNPYNLISVSRSAWDRGNGHGGHADDFLAPDGATEDEDCGGSAGGGGGGDNDKVLICHATSSDTNPYNLISVSRNAWDEEAGTGHAGHEDDFLAPEGATDDEDCGDGGGDGAGGGGGGGDGEGPMPPTDTTLSGGDGSAENSIGTALALLTGLVAFAALLMRPMGRNRVDIKNE